MLHDFICMRFWKRWHYSDREWISGCKTLRVGKSVTTKEGSTKELFEMIEILCILIIVIVQSLSHVQVFMTPWTAAHQASLSFTNSRSLLKLMCIESVMPSNHLILCHPLLLPPSIFPSTGVFSNESVLRTRWPKYLSFSFSSSVLPMNIQDWFPLRLTGWISLQSKGISRVFSNTPVQKHQFFGTYLY